MTEAQESALTHVLVTRLQQSSTSSAPTRQAALLALERLGTPADDVTLLAVLPHLLDSNVCHLNDWGFLSITGVGWWVETSKPLKKLFVVNELSQIVYPKASQRNNYFVDGSCFLPPKFPMTRHNYVV